MSHPFDRPVFIVAAPRSCSTLLFQVLARSRELWSPGDESHAIFEGHRKLSPGRGAVDSNRLTATLLDPVLAHSIRERFAMKLRDRDGRPYASAGTGPVRLLEKTPKNALRIPFIDALFPDALFIHLVRDPLPNIGSIVDAWRSGKFVTYPRFQTAHGPWSLLLPPGWQRVCARPLEEIAAFQWCSANRCIVEDLARIDPVRWTAIHATELLERPEAAVERLLAFMGVEPDPELRANLQNPLPLSRYTLTAPDAAKWQRHAPQLARIWPAVEAQLPVINRHLEGRTRPLSAQAPERAA
jgi:hypothetical protein